MLDTPLSPVRLTAFGLRREPPRPPEHREPGYEQRFEADTLFYDVTLSADGRTITAPGPPLLNTEAAVLGGRYTTRAGGPPLTPRHVQHVNGATTRFDLPPGEPADALSITIDGRTATAPIRPSLAQHFTGRRVLMAMSKDNDPQWLRDWATYHARLHGTDALLLYDNASTRYTVDQLRDRLDGIEGIDAWAVIDWPYAFGPGTGPNGEYDSNYSQMGAITHARWRFAEDAEAFLFTDPDELVLAKDGGSVYDALRDSDAPCLTIAGRWVTAVRPTWPKTPPPSVTDAPCLHHACVYQTRQPMYLTKWVASPGRCDDGVQWLLHCLIGLPEPFDAAADYHVPTTTAFETRHCVQISTGWKYDRGGLPRYHPGRHRFDRAFAEALARAFPDRTVHRATGRPLRDLWSRLRLIR